MSRTRRRATLGLLLLAVIATAARSEPEHGSDDSGGSGAIGALEGTCAPPGDVRACPAPRLAPDALHWAEGGFLSGGEACPQLHANDPELITRVDGGRVIAVSTLSPALARSFRGTFEVRLQQDAGAPTRTWVHVIQRSGERGRTPLVELTVPPGGRARATLRTVYSANNQAPQALRLEVAPGPLPPP